jgi:hypothetical protein
VISSVIDALVLVDVVGFVMVVVIYAVLTNDVEVEAPEPRREACFQTTQIVALGRVARSGENIACGPSPVDLYCRLRYRPTNSSDDAD